MSTTTLSGIMLNKIVLGYLDGRRVRGYVSNFSPMNDLFQCIQERDLAQKKGTEISLKDLKAVFFVKDFKGNSKYKESQKIEIGKPGRKVEVTFFDGEKIVGTAPAYNPKHAGFFLIPADPKSNCIRIFVVNWNVRDVKFI